MMGWLTSPAHSRWLEAEGDRLLEFGTAARHPAGGFAWLDEAGEADLDRPVELWVTCRMTHVYSLAQLMGRPWAGALADHGLAALSGRFRDQANGGWYTAVSGDGSTATDKLAYGHAFVVIAAASASAAGRNGARALLDDALGILVGRFWDDEYGMVVEEWDESFSHCDGYRGVNANMHAVEALLAAADVLDDPSLRVKAQRILTRVIHVLAPDNHWQIPEHFDDSWTPQPAYNAEAPADPFRPYGATVGHWLEWARLAVQLWAGLGGRAPTWLLDDARALFQASVAEGWSVDGADGFVYTVDWDGAPVVHERMHWVMAEATATAAVLYKATGDPSYAGWYEAWWEHIADCFLDPANGSWHHELSRLNRPSSVIWNGKPDIYHAFQATLIPRLPLGLSIAPALREGGLC
jgi:mannose/cellobiose epimerase-like protein (N-acyl-D-glucosamine 2-epimerase family)